MASLDEQLKALENKHSSPPETSEDSLDENLAELQQGFSFIPDPLAENLAALQEQSAVLFEDAEDPLAANLAALTQQSLVPANDPLGQQLADVVKQLQPPQEQSAESAKSKADLAAMLSALEQETSANQLKQSQANQQICQSLDNLIQFKRQQRINAREKAAAVEANAKAIAEAEKLKKQRYKYWQQKASRWLDELDPISNEGMWFYGYAEAYESPLDAAIDYLMALE